MAKRESERESRGGKERVWDGGKRSKVGDGRESIGLEREIKSRGWGRERVADGRWSGRGRT